MEIEKFEMAIAINEELDMLRKHKEDLKKSHIQFGGGLIFIYNSNFPNVSLIDEIYGGIDFFRKYMKSLDAKIQSLEEEFAKL